MWVDTVSECAEASGSVAPRLTFNAGERLDAEFFKTLHG
jgi:hypothetical protein